MSTLNMRMGRFRLVAVATLLSGLTLNSCVDMAGSTSTGNTGKGSISGRVVDAAGHGIGNARVKVFSVNYNPGPIGAAAGDVADVVLTEADGSFQTDSLSEGRYNLFGEKAGLLALQDSISVTSTSSTQSGNLELKPPGTLRGVVSLKAGHDSRTVFLLLPGTPVFAVPQDSNGNFRIGPLAEGHYHLRLLSTLDNYKPLDTILTVFSGVDTVLKDTLRLAYQGAAFGELPLVESVKLNIDTSRIKVSLSWPKSPDARVAAYNVYRRRPDLAYERLTTAPLTDTVFSEDWIIEGLNPEMLNPGETLHYAVTTLDKQGNEGRKAQPLSFVLPSRFKWELVFKDSTLYPEAVDIAPDGSIWHFDENRRVVRHGTSGEITGWYDSSFTQHPPYQIVLDNAGDVYLLSVDSPNPVTHSILSKYSPTGIRRWQIDLPPTMTNLALQRSDSSIMVWQKESEVGIWTHFSKDGIIKSIDSLPVHDDFLEPVYKSGIGYYRLQRTNFSDSSFIDFLDNRGQVTSTWRIPVSSISDIERDENGRWYFVDWASIEVYTPQREFAGLIPTLYENPGRLLRRNGSLYVFKHIKGAYRILPRF